MISIAHNMVAMNANRQYNIVTGSKAKTTEKLSSGYKINRAADDAAGLSMSEKMRRQIRGLNRATENCQDGVSFNQIADGAMNEISDMLNRMEVLSVKAANGTNTDMDRSYIEAEIKLLKDQIDQIEHTTTFNEIPVFAWDRKKTTYTEAPSGANVVDKVEDYVLDKTKYGLVDVIGEDHIYGGSKLDYKLKFTGTDWESTGKLSYTDKIYQNPGSIPRRWNQTDMDDMGTMISNLYNGDLHVGTINYVLNYEYAKHQANPTYAHTEHSISDGTNAFKLYMDYDNNITDLNGNYLPDKISIQQTAKDGNPIEGELHTYELANYGNGLTGVNNGMAYGSSWIDFSELGSNYAVEDLYGQGFNSTCATCSKHYSIYFTGEGPAYSEKGSGQSLRLEVNISGCTTGKDVVDSIINAVENTPSFSNHFQQYAVNKNNPAKIYLYDNRNEWSDGNISTFEPAARDENNQLMIGDTTKHDPATDRIEYEITDGDGIWIQAGSEAHSGFYNKRAHVSTWSLGIDQLTVIDEENANAAIDMVKSAILILGEQRSMVGAQQNRCENAIKVDANSAENMTASESRIRDTDMSSEMVKYSLNNILAQAGEAMLSQANQSNQGVLSLLQ